MHPGALARTYQIRAALREGPLTTAVLYQKLGSPTLNQWGYVDTLRLLHELYAVDLIDVAAPSCCGHHAIWVLPAG